MRAENLPIAIHIIHVFLSYSQATGTVFLFAGFWIALKLHKYLELDSDVSSGLPLFFTGLGVFVIVLTSCGCHCAVKGAAPKLYVVSGHDDRRLENPILALASLALCQGSYAKISRNVP